MKKLIIIGSSYFQLPLIKKAKEMGLEIHVFAWEKGAVGKEIIDYFYPISIIEKEKILEITRKIKPDGITSIASDLAMTTVNFVAENLGLIGNSMDVALQTTNKYVMRKKLTAGGLPCPWFHVYKGKTGKMPEGLDYPLIVKPTDRSGSRGVTKVTDKTKLQEAIDRAITESFNGEILIEEFIHGNEISVEMITYEGEHFPLAITDKETTGAPYFVEYAHHQPSELSKELQSEVFRLVSNGLSCLGHKSGASHSELLITPDKKSIFVEIGARMGGDCIGSNLVELSTGYDFVRGVIEIALGEFREVNITKSMFSGIYFIQHRPGLVQHIDDLTDYFPQVVKKEIHAILGENVGEIKESADRLGYYIYQDIEKFVPGEELLKVCTL